MAPGDVRDGSGVGDTLGLASGGRRVHSYCIVDLYGVLEIEIRCSRTQRAFEAVMMYIKEGAKRTIEGVVTLRSQ